MEVVKDDELLILNGRFGPESARITYERDRKINGQMHQRTQTLIDYALCHQRWAKSIQKLEIHANTGRHSDHRPLHLHITCDTVDATCPIDDHLASMEWWEDEKRSLVDVSPFRLALDDPIRVKLETQYQLSLTGRLEAPLMRLRALANQHKCCQ